MNMYAFINTHMHALAIAAKRGPSFQRDSGWTYGKVWLKKWRGKIL